MNTAMFLMYWAVDTLKMEDIEDIFEVSLKQLSDLVSLRQVFE